MSLLPPTAHKVFGRWTSLARLNLAQISYFADSAQLPPTIWGNLRPRCTHTCTDYSGSTLTCGPSVRADTPDRHVEAHLRENGVFVANIWAQVGHADNLGLRRSLTAGPSSDVIQIKGRSWADTRARASTT